MTSNIDPTKPETGIALTRDIRANFAAAKAELEAEDSRSIAQTARITAIQQRIAVIEAEQIVQNSRLDAIEALITMQLNFAGDTRILFPAGTLPTPQNKHHTFEYTINTPANVFFSHVWNHQIGRQYGDIVQDNANLGASRSDMGPFYVNAGLQANTETVVKSVYTNGANTVDFTCTPGGSGQITGINNFADPLNTWAIGGRPDGTFSFVGVIKNFKIYNENDVLIHHWPINDNVPDGGTIVDIVGDLNGTLVLGSGSWEAQF